MFWIISANEKIYDHASAFQKFGFIDWHQRNKYHIGDIVYIYCTKPYQRVLYKTIVDKESMSFNEIVDDSLFWKDKNKYTKVINGKYARLKLIDQAWSENLTLTQLKNNGLSSIPQGPMRISSSLAKYINENMNDFASSENYPDSNGIDELHEGMSCKVLVNKYERSSIARMKCIESKGTSCYVCGINFKDTYGTLGEGFIHVHHIVPLNEIRNDYVINYETDLIPVCPNCHAMLHRKIDGKSLSYVELRDLIKNNK